MKDMQEGMRWTLICARGLTTSSDSWFFGQIVQGLYAAWTHATSHALQHALEMFWSTSGGEPEFDLAENAPSSLAHLASQSEAAFRESFARFSATELRQHLHRLAKIFTRLRIGLCDGFSVPQHNKATVGAKTSASTGPVKTSTVQKAWWKEQSVYRVYPSSFKDSNGDGIGDIAGIIEKLDYIKALGVDLVWICPVYSSPQVDMGYDIADYRAIDPRYGTMEDIEQLIEELHRRGLKLVQDLVVNHTSDQHEWFRQSRSSKTNAFRDWYIWRKPRYNGHGQRQPPNNWSSYFGGSAWEYDDASNEYYLHLFAKEQPDLNWECDAMRNEVYDTMRFWLDKGVDGFRLDVINLISKDPSFPDAEVVHPEHTYQHGSKYYANGPRIHEYLRVIGGILTEYDAFSVGEMPWISDSAEILNCVGSDRHELNMIFNFDIVEGIDHGSGGKFSPK
ncbi:maltose permease [Elasticomyces elasticus]|nr:maltose permease [Elasticomyces elasticus]